jgi:hypothetical protein
VHIALDANILIADRWLRSRKMQALRDFVRKSAWRILLHEVVVAEVKARTKRDLEANIKAVESALLNAQRQGVHALPQLNSEKALKETLDEWDRNFLSFFNERITSQMPMGEAAPKEAVRRAAERIRPCSEKGDGMRDAVIWLDLLSASGPEGNYAPIAFISDNTRDFAAPGDTSLHPRLLEDITANDSLLTYYSSLDTFLQEHAAPIDYITEEWINERLSVLQVGDEVESWVRSGGSLEDFTVASPAYSAYFAPIEPPSFVDSVRISLTDFFVWRFDDGHLQLHLDVDVKVNATMLCQRLPAPPPDVFERAPEDLVVEKRYLGCNAHLLCAFSALVQGCTITSIAFEDARRA